ncbi:uncharacterized protein [Eurosta solidaginis]|uniref:uncharacterized protein n=1 Tax=Eurosta solidaginis TaxID=178769 RepID=UPI00353149EC
MLLSMRNLNSIRAFCFYTLGLMLLLVLTVSAQGQNEQFIIGVAEQPNDLADGTVDDAADAGGEFTFELPATGLRGSAFGAAELLQAPDVVVEGLNLLQRNNLVAAAGNMEKSKPQQRIRLALNSGLRRRSVDVY